jgi:Secretion system C-terminal sorting domain
MHEIGHIFGGLHHNDNAVSYAKGFAVDVDNWLGFIGPVGNWQTIMATYQSVNRIDKFSNPSQTLYGEPTGDANHDVVRRIRERMDAVAEFRNGETNIGVNISGDRVLTKNDTYIYSPILSCETNPLTFKWEFSATGFNYTTISTSPTASLSITKQSYLSLTVTDALGKSKRVTITLTVNTSNQQPIRQNNGNSTTFPDNTVKTVAYPNPVTGNEFNLDIEVVSDNQDLSIDLLNSEGKVLSNVSKKALNKGVHIEVVNIKNVSNGIYTIMTKIGQQILTQKIVVLR